METVTNSCLTMKVDERTAAESRGECLTVFADKRGGSTCAERNREQVKAWRARNPHKVSADNQKRHAANRDANLARKRDYYQRVRKAKDATETGRWADRDRKARRRAAIKDDRVTEAEWVAIVKAHGGRCAYCGCTDAPLTQDHIKPLSRGGRHLAANIAPACRPCNSRKGNR